MTTARTGNDSSLSKHELGTALARVVSAIRPLTSRQAEQILTSAFSLHETRPQEMPAATSTERPPRRPREPRYRFRLDR